MRQTRKESFLTWETRHLILHAKFEVDLSSEKFFKNMENVALSLIFPSIYRTSLGKIGKAFKSSFSHSCAVLTGKILLQD